jgi:ankyrin repeat protein
LRALLLYLENKTDLDGRTPLFYVQSPEIADMLLAKYDPNIIDAYGDTALTHAIKRCAGAEIIKKLLVCDQNIADSRKCTPLMLAIAYGYRDLIPMMADDNNSQNKDEHTALVYNLWDNFPLSKQFDTSDPNIKDKSGQTALFCARSVDQVRWLLEHKADPNVIDVHGFTPLMHFVTASNPTKLEDEDDRDARKTRITRDFLGMVRELAPVSNVDQQHSQSGKTPLSIAVENNDTKMIDLLLEHGADPDRSGVLIKGLEIRDERRKL